MRRSCGKTLLLESNTRSVFFKLSDRDFSLSSKQAISFIAMLMEGEILPSELTPAIQDFLHASVPLSKVQKAVENFVVST